MLPSPSSSPIRPTFSDSTNVYHQRTPVKPDSSFVLPTPPEHAAVKRLRQPLSPISRERTRKRAKLFLEADGIEEPELPIVEDEDTGGEDIAVAKARVRRRTVFALRSNAAIGRPSFASWTTRLPTRSILQTFVSSHKSDVYKCFSEDDNGLVPPYACAFSHGAKHGTDSRLAMATEDGAVHIMSTARRKDWDPEPPRVTLRPHDNGIFDIQWSSLDGRLATASGDHTARVLDPSRPDAEPLHTLDGGLATIKSVAWRAAGESILATGGRDGRILVWDLRKSSYGETLQPVITFSLDKADEKALKLKGRKAKLGSAPSRSITGLLWAEGDDYSLTSSGSLDGILRRWDFRLPSSTSRSRTPAPVISKSELDPTTQHDSLRPRGLTSLTAGHGPTAGLLFAHGADTRVHAYYASSLQPLPSFSALTHDGLGGTSFYVRTALSPCGSWLASGCSGASGTAFLFDVSGLASAVARGLPTEDVRPRAKSVRICAQKGEVGAVDWADDAIATCADDGTVRLWRPDIVAHRRCETEPEEATWDWAWAV